MKNYEGTLFFESKIICNSLDQSILENGFELLRLF